jgi:hypothetical protein
MPVSVLTDLIKKLRARTEGETQKAIAAAKNAAGDVVDRRAAFKKAFLVR